VIEAPHPRESLWQASDPQARRPDAGAKHRTHRAMFRVLGFTGDKHPQQIPAVFSEADAER